MKKEWTRDYATGAFIRYANRGCPTCEEYENRVRQDVYNRLALLPPNIVLMKADAAIGIRKPLLDDIDAVNKTLAMFEKNDQAYIAEAVKTVYYGLPEDCPPAKNELTLRVRRFAQTHFVSEISVYKGLKRARYLFSTFHNLTIGFCDDDFLF